MANAKVLFPFILKWEGGLVNHPNDPGGLTNKGLTYSNYTAHCKRVLRVNPSLEHFYNIKDSEIYKFFKVLYWDRCSGDAISDQRVANVLVDFFWGSGYWALIRLQHLLGVKLDGIIGPITLGAINSQEDDFYQVYTQSRIDYLETIIKQTPSLGVFRQGWLNRVKDLDNLNKTI